MSGWLCQPLPLACALSTLLRTQGPGALPELEPSSPGSPDPSLQPRPVCRPAGGRQLALPRREEAGALHTQWGGIRRPGPQGHSFLVLLFLKCLQVSSYWDH